MWSKRIKWKCAKLPIWVHMLCGKK
jgi:hypothetical protein